MNNETLLNQNLSLLTNISEDQKQSIIRTESNDYEIEPSRIPELYTLKIKGKYLYSKYNPLKPLSKQIPQIEEINRTVIILGLGLGYHIDYLIENYPEKKFFVIENDFEIVKKYLSVRDIKKIVKNHNVNFIFINQPVMIGKILDSKIEYEDLNKLKIFEIYDKFDFHKEFYLSVKKAISEMINSQLKNFWTKYVMEEDWQKNLVDNFKYIQDSTPINKFFYQFKNIPAVIVGAGPSLDKNVHLLKKVKDYALILCVDTALRTLISKDIEPDFVISLDAQKANYKDYKGIDTSDLRLIYDLITYPDIVSNFKGDRIVSISGHHILNPDGSESVEFVPLWEILKDSIEEIGYLQTGGSVSTSAFDLARIMECNPIIFIGQDLAFSENKIHTSSSTDVTDLYGSINKFNTVETQNYITMIGNGEAEDIYVESIDGRKIKTNSSMRHYLAWLSDACGLVSAECIDCTEGGAKIENTKIMTFNATIKKYMKNKKGIIDKINSLLDFKSKINESSLSSMIKNYSDNFNQIIYISNSFFEKTDLKNIEFDFNECEKEIEFKNKIESLNMNILKNYFREYNIKLNSLKKSIKNTEKLSKAAIILWFQVIRNASKNWILLFEKILESENNPLSNR